MMATKKLGPRLVNSNSKSSKNEIFFVSDTGNSATFRIWNDPHSGFVAVKVSPKDSSHPFATLTDEQVAKIHSELGKYLKSRPNAPKSQEKLYTSHELAVLLQMDPSSIVKWVNDGALKSYRTPGGHRRIQRSEALRFVKEHGMYVPTELQD